MNTGTDLTVASGIDRVPPYIGGRWWRELLLGPAYWWHKVLIERSRRWDEGRQRAYQFRKVLPLFRRYGDTDVRSKAHYRQHQARYNRFCIPGPTKVMRTGGTAGEPFVFYMDTFARRQKERAYLFDIWAAAGYRPFDLRVVYRGNIGSDLISYSWIENAYVISPSQLTPQNSGQVVEFLKGTRPFFLHVYPSSLFSFIELVGEKNFRELPIRGVLAGSEVFPTAQRNAFEEKFDLPVAHWYGHSEYAVLAKQCRECDGFHFYPTYGYPELVPDETSSQRIVATSFNAIGTRFVRYDTGDLATPADGRCSAPFFSVAAVQGREQEYFIDRAGQRRAFGPYLFGIHDEFWDRVSAIQFLQQQPGRLDVRLTLKSSGHRVWLEAYLQQRFAVCDLGFEYVSEIPKTKAGKHRYYLSLLKDPEST